MKNRMERINSLLRKEISLIIMQDINDPRIGFISIISVDCSSDLKNAKVYFTSQSNDKKKMEMLLNRASGFIGHRLGEG
jgi:ribosome-binding factor A